MEYLLIESMVLAYIRKQRAVQAEKAFLTQGSFPMIRYTDGGATEPDLIQVDHGNFDIIDRTYIRYISAFERQFYRALHELQRIQDIRLGKKPSSISVDVIRDGIEE